MNLKLLLSLLFSFAATYVFAQTHRDEFGIQTDNDSYLGKGSDRYYTDGLFFYYNHALSIKDAANPALQNKVLGFELGQKIFNPQGGDVPGPEYIDRPFAGYLYAASTLNFLYKNESNLKIGAQLGVVGPASGGQSVQEFVHRIFRFYHPEGWQYQIKNDVELNLSAAYNRLLYRTDGIDITAGSYVNLGTGFIGAGIGSLFRFGVFNQLFNSASTQSTAIAGSAVAPLTKHEIFVHYKPLFNYVGYDATIQGGLFEKHNVAGDPEVVRDPEHTIFSNEIGATYTSSRWIFDAAATFHTREVAVMINPHQWGSLTVFYRFN